MNKYTFTNWTSLLAIVEVGWKLYLLSGEDAHFCGYLIGSHFTKKTVVFSGRLFNSWPLSSITYWPEKSMSILLAMKNNTKKTCCNTVFITLPWHLIPCIIKPHKKLRQESHQWGPLNVWIWNRRIIHQSTGLFLEAPID